ncbi:MAG: RtcB family protein [Phycisphaerales bacterium]
MRDACSLPVTAAAALMPDAHVGYGLPIGGVLATHNAVIPYAVGVDIACRVMLTVFDLDASRIPGMRDKLKKILESATLFGVGKEWRPADRPDHAVMDEDWSITPVTAALKDLAHRQLGTSGSGNHFVEWGEFQLNEPTAACKPGNYLAVVSHSGSRGPGAKVCAHYSRLAEDLHPELEKSLRHLAWLSMDADQGAGEEYFAAMELMGRFASANHHIIHAKIARALNQKVALQIENHHNFAWKETHNGREVIVHRKGATPAAAGQLGYIPGSMTAPGYLVAGKGEPASLNSASHGAGRLMSRSAARRSLTRSDLRRAASEAGVEVLSAGIDESPHVYKDIEQVLEAQADLVRRLGRFTPRIVKMAPDGERAED